MNPKTPIDKDVVTATPPTPSPAQEPTANGNTSKTSGSKASKKTTSEKRTGRHPNSRKNLKRKGTSITREQLLLRRDQITVLKFDYGLTLGEIATQLKMSIGRVSEELKAIMQEFNKQMDPGARNVIINRQDRHYLYIIGKLYQDMGTTARGSKERLGHLAELRSTLTAHAAFLRSTGQLHTLPIQLEVKQVKTVNEEAILRLAEDILAKKGEPDAQKET